MTRYLTQILMVITLTPLFLLTGNGAQAADRYIGLILGSEHVGSTTMNNINPGLTYGHRWPGARDGVEYHLEGGVFYNSYKEVSPIVLGGLSFRLAEVAGGEMRFGGSIGTAYYKELSTYLKAQYGIPSVGGFVPIAAMHLSWRYGNFDYRLTTVPADRDTKAIINLSIAMTF